MILSLHPPAMDRDRNASPSHLPASKAQLPLPPANHNLPPNQIQLLSLILSPLLVGQNLRPMLLNHSLRLLHQTLLLLRLLQSMSLQDRIRLRLPNRQWLFICLPRTCQTPCGTKTASSFKSTTFTLPSISNSFGHSCPSRIKILKRILPLNLILLSASSSSPPTSSSMYSPVPNRALTLSGGPTT